MYFLMSSSHLILGLAFLRFRCIDNHSVTVLVHQSSFILATCPAHQFVVSPIHLFDDLFLLCQSLLSPCFFELFSIYLAFFWLPPKSDTHMSFRLVYTDYTLFSSGLVVSFFSVSLCNVQMLPNLLRFFF